MNTGILRNSLGDGVVVRKRLWIGVQPWPNRMTVYIAEFYRKCHCRVALDWRL